METLSPSEAVARSVAYTRRLRGWNQQQLADRLSSLGVPMQQATVARIERGKRGVSLDDAVALAVALGISLTHLVAGPAVDDDQIRLTPDEKLDADLARE